MTWGLFQASWRSLVVWSVCFCAGHLVWLPSFLQAHLGLSLLAASGLYGALVLWLVSMSGAYWAFAGQITRQCKGYVVVRVLMLSIYFFCMTNFSLPFKLGTSGYPFMNPLLPLMSLVVKQQSLEQGSWQIVSLHGRSCAVLPLGLRASDYIAPRAQRVAEIYLQLAAVGQPPAAEMAVILTPESFFPYKMVPQELASWQSILPDRTFLLLGTVGEVAR